MRKTNQDNGIEKKRHLTANTTSDNHQEYSIRLKIGIFGHYGNQNLGDESIIKAAINNFTCLEPKISIRSYSLNPQDSQDRHKVPAFPIRYLAPKKADHNTSGNYPNESDLPKNQVNKNKVSLGNKLVGFLNNTPLLKKIVKIPIHIYTLSKEIIQEICFCCSSYKNAKDLHLLVVAGSNQFLDNFGGPWGFPYTLFKWAIIAKLAGSKLAFASVGAGPLDSSLSKFFVKTALFFSDYTSVRDHQSKMLLKSIGFKRKSTVFPDIAHSLTFKKTQMYPHASLLPVVGINPMPVYDRRYWCHTDDSKYSDYISKLAIFVELLLRKNHKVFLFNTMPKDLLVIEDIICILKKKSLPDNLLKSNLSVEKSHTVSGLMDTIMIADLIVATRFHGVVLSILAEKPVIGICYHQKIEALLKDFELGDYALGFDSFSVELLDERFQKLCRNLSIEKNKICKQRKRIVPALQQQYKTLISIAKESKKWKKQN